MPYTAEIGGITLLSGDGDIDNEVISDVATISFTSTDITFNGHVTITTIAGELIFDSPNVNLVGNETIVTNEGAVISFTSPMIEVYSYSGIISNDVASVSFTSPNHWVGSLDGMVINDVANIIFDSPNISITGNEIIIPSNGKLSFVQESNASVGVWTLVQTGGFAILSDKPKIVLSSDEIIIVGDEVIISPPVATLKFSSNALIGDIVFPIPRAIEFSGNASAGILNAVMVTPGELFFNPTEIILVGNVFAPTEFDVTLPMFIFGDSTGGFIDIELPKSLLSCAAQTNILSTLISDFPSLDITITTGGNIVLALSEFEFLSSGSIPISSDLKALFGKITSFMEASVESNDNNLTNNFPSLTLSIDTLAGQTANITFSLLPFTLSATALAGNVGEIDGNFPKIKVIISGNYGNKLGDLVMSFKEFKLVMKSGELPERILRYITGEIR